MKKATIDLCVGSGVGLQALRTAPAGMISTVFSDSERIRLEAKELGFVVSSCDLNHFATTTADTAVSVHYPVILEKETIQRYRKVYNLHPGFLPWGRGWYPVFWALFRGEPAGATLHEIDEGLDQGPIVKQIAVQVRPDDDGQSLHERVMLAEGSLLEFMWSELRKGTVPPAVSQDLSKGSYHTKKEFDQWKRNPPLNKMSPKELLDLIRALSYRGYSGLELKRGQTRFSVTMVPIESGQIATSDRKNGWSTQQ